ncbi:MAG: hypothetical protein L3J75_12650 [Methylococcaceae bacterium]|nr:hypothetical protein [Methylococcaceae bacterium]
MNEHISKAMSKQIIEVGERDTKSKDKTQDKVLDKRQAQIEKMYKPHSLEYTPIVFSAVILFVIYWGWQAELEYYITPESGLGYALGIIGGVMMLVMLIYSLRKRLKSMREWGLIRYWFKAHMVLGIVGPVLILFHCNFQLGSQNGNIALISMLLVVASGIAGRYFYGRIHFGVYGSEMTLQQLQQDQLIARYELSRLFEISPELYENIKKYDDVVQKDSQGLISSFFKICRMAIQTRNSNRVARRMLVKSCRKVAVEEGWKHGKVESIIDNGIIYLNAHYMTIRKLVGLAFFEKIFSFWHILHVPLFYMLIFTATVHILAVHMY